MSRFLDIFSFIQCQLSPLLAQLNLYVVSIVFGHDFTDVGILCIIFWSQVMNIRLKIV